jgi:hypothetical protein
MTPITDPLGETTRPLFGTICLVDRTNQPASYTKEVKMSEKMATVEEVLNATKETAPKGWTVSHEYPNCVGVTHLTFTDEEFIMLGDINGFFSFNDTDAETICGDMEDLTDAKEIAESFWKQVGATYPQLMEKRKGITPEQLERVKKILTEQKEKDANNG